MGHLTYNTRLVFDSDSDKELVMKMLEAQQLAWNQCSITRFRDVTKNSIVDLHKAFYRKFRDAHPEIPAQIVISAEQSVLSAYRSVKSNKHKIIIPCEKKKLSVRLDKRMYSVKLVDQKHVFSIISLTKRVKCGVQTYPKLQEHLDKYKFCDPELFVRDGDVWINLTFDIPTLLPKQTLAVGIDLGIRVFAATSEGNIYIDRKFNKEKRKLRYIKRCLKSKSKVSKSAKRHFKKLRHKEANKNKSFTHNLVNQILCDTKADVLVIEDLKGIKTKKNKFKNLNRISQIPFYQFKQILTYKAALLPEPKTVISVNPRFSSQIDSVTGKKEGVRKGRRFYSLSGKVYDAELNAAVNIAKRSKHPVSCGNILDGQASVRGLNVVGSSITSCR